MVTQQTLPLKFEPPFRDPILDATGRMPDTWVSWFTRTSDRMADHETRIEGLEARMTALELRVTTLETRMTLVENRVTALEAEVSSILARLATAGIP
jgi:hypothetical protein